MRLPVSIPMDPTSFLLGFAFATVFWWVVSRAHPLWTEIVASIRRRRDEANARSMSGTEEDHRHVPLCCARGTNLAAPLLALDEDLAPKLMLPPAGIEPGGLAGNKDIVTIVLPYMPALPELAAVYDPNEDERLAALAHLQGHPDEGISKQICAAMYGDDAMFREAAFSVFGRLVPRTSCSQTPSSTD